MDNANREIGCSSLLRDREDQESIFPIGAMPYRWWPLVPSVLGSSEAGFKMPLLAFA